MFESILCQVTEYDPDVLESLIGLAVEIAREGREGRRVGTLFMLGDEDAVLARSRPTTGRASMSDCAAGAANSV